jgi:hypothetical protein
MRADARRLATVVDVADPEFARLKPVVDPQPKHSRAADRESDDVRSGVAPDHRRQRTPERVDPASRWQDDPR